MIRRVAVFLVLGALFAIPGVASPAKKDLPVPTAGAPHIWLCQNVYCGNGEDTVVGSFSFGVGSPWTAVPTKAPSEWIS